MDTKGEKNVSTVGWLSRHLAGTEKKPLGPVFDEVIEMKVHSLATHVLPRNCARP